MGEVVAPASAEAALLTRARRRDPAAVDALYVAHVLEARRLALRLAGASLADDLVADSFARVISQLHAGRGPSEDFRSYLLATIRNRFRDVQRRARWERPVSHQSWILEGGVDPVDGPEASLERTVADDRVAAAFDSLPEDWREVLWHVELRGRAVPEVAVLMGLTPAAVSSLAYRAREGLRLAYLDQLLDDPTVEDRECRWVRERLSRYLRDRVGDRAGRRVEAHLGECRSCSGATEALSEVNRRLAAILLPAFLAYPAKLALVPSAAGGSVVAGAVAEVSTWSSLAALKSSAVAAAVMVGVTASTLSSVPAEASPPGPSPVARVTAISSGALDRTDDVEPGAGVRRRALPTASPAPASGDQPDGNPPGTPGHPAQPPITAEPDCEAARGWADPPLLVGAVLGVLTAPLRSEPVCVPAPPPSTPSSSPLDQGVTLVRGILEQVDVVLPPAVADLARELTDVVLPRDEPLGSEPSGHTAPAPADAESPAPPAPRPSVADPAPSTLERVAGTGRRLLEAAIELVDPRRRGQPSRDGGDEDAAS